MSDDTFRSDFPETPNAVLAERYGISLSTVTRLARKYGLRKSDGRIKQKQRENATGRILDSNSRDRIRQKALGRKLTPETIQKILKTKRARGTIYKGHKHYAWKGGKPWERFKGRQYLDWRNAVLERDRYRCQDCGRECRKREKGLAAHHIKPYSLFPEFRFDIDNGITLCRVCHMAAHGKTVPIRMIPCGCGCGTMIRDRDPWGRERRFANFHCRPSWCSSHLANRSNSNSESSVTDQQIDDQYDQQNSANADPTAVSPAGIAKAAPKQQEQDEDKEDQIHMRHSSARMRGSYLKAAPNT